MQFGDVGFWKFGKAHAIFPEHVKTGKIYMYIYTRSAITNAGAKKTRPRMIDYDVLLYTENWEDADYVGRVKNIHINALVGLANHFG